MDDPSDTTPLSTARRQARRELHDVQMIELQQLARDLSEAEHRVSVSRERLDGRLYYLHEDGVSIAELARNARRSRETVYAAIDRYRASIPTSTIHQPEISADGLSDMQLDGLACIACGHSNQRPLQPAGFGPHGQMFCHAECVAPAG